MQSHAHIQLIFYSACTVVILSINFVVLYVLLSYFICKIQVHLHQYK